MSNITTLRTINVERLRHPEGWFLVIMNEEASDEYCSAWESAELALADADHLKRIYSPAIIRDKTGDA